MGWGGDRSGVAGRTGLGVLVKPQLRTGYRSFLHSGFGGAGEGVTREREVREHLRRRVSPLLRFQAPEQAASSEAASQSRKQVSIEEKGYESTK